MNLGQIVLYSKNKIILSRYLSYLLELEQELVDDAIRLNGEDIRFLVRNYDAKEIITSNGTLLEYFVDSKEMLEQLVQKVFFLNYRIGECVNESISIIEQVGNSYFFYIDDPDGRKWKFTYINPV